MAVFQIVCPVFLSRATMAASRAARREHEPVAVHERRLAELPAGHHRAAEVAGEALAPALLARWPSPGRRGRRRCRARRGARRPRWACPRPRRIRRRARARRPRRPDELAVGAGEREHVLGAVLVAHRVDAVAGHGHAGEAGAEALRLPEQGRPAGRPLGEEARLGRDGRRGSARASPASPRRSPRARAPPRARPRAPARRPAVPRVHGSSMLLPARPASRPGHVRRAAPARGKDKRRPKARSKHRLTPAPLDGSPVRDA